MPGHQDLDEHKLFASPTEKLEVCNDQLSGAMRDLKNALTRVIEVGQATSTELQALPDGLEPDNPAIARANSLLFESQVMVDGFFAE